VALAFDCLEVVCSIANNSVSQLQPQLLVNPPPVQAEAPPQVLVDPDPSADRKIQAFTDTLNQAVGPTRETLLRDKAIFPRGLRPEFGRQGGIDAGMLREITAIRDVRKNKHPVENNLVKDQTLDPSQENFLKLEAGSAIVDLAADLVPMIVGNSTGIETFSSEVVGSFVGAIPEFYLLVSKCREISSGEVRVASAIETLKTLDKLLDEIDGFQKTNQGSLTPGDEQKLADLGTKIKGLREGLEATFKLNIGLILDARAERKHILVGLGGGAIEFGSAATQAAAEHTGNAALGTAGASLGLVAGPLSMYFTGKVIKEEGERTDDYRKNQISALTALKNHPGYRTESSAGEAVSLTRALSKMATERSSVKESRLKRGLFATGFAATLVGTVQSGLLLGGVAGASAVGMVASGLGVAVFFGFVGYGIYKLATSKASSTKQLQKAAFHNGGEHPKMLLELARIQSLKAKNDITTVVLRERLRDAIQLIKEGDSHEQKKEKLTTALRPLAEASPEGKEVADGVIREILYQFPKTDFVDFMVDQERQGAGVKSREEVFQSLLESALNSSLASRQIEKLVASKNKAHVALVDNETWSKAILDHLLTDRPSVLKEALNDAFPVPCEMPTPDSVVEAVKACKARFEEIGVEANTVEAMRPILREKLLETSSPETADRLTDVVINHLFPRIDGVESLRKLEDILDQSKDLKKRITDSHTRAFQDALQASSIEMGKLSAARKLLRRDPEMLLYTMIDAIQRADREDRVDDSNLLKSELAKYGVSEETLADALKAESINQRLDAAGLIAKSLNFL